MGNLTAKLSGNSYVPMQSLVHLDRPVMKVQIKASFNCDHGATVCEDCVGEWQMHNKVYFARTAGGRALADKVHPLSQYTFQSIVVCTDDTGRTLAIGPFESDLDADSFAVHNLTGVGEWVHVELITAEQYLS